MIFILLILFSIILASGVYHFFYFRRCARFWRLPADTLWGKIALILLAVLSMLPFLSMRSILALIVLHSFFLGLILTLLNFLFRRFSLWRRAYGSGLLSIFLIGCLFLSGYINMQSIHCTQYTLASQKLTEPVRIVYISDLHYPTAMDAERLRALCEEISAAEADVLIMGGDMLDESTEKEELLECISLLGSIETKKGCFFTFGNHDRSSYAENPNYSPSDLSAALEQAGIQILRDSTVSLGEITLIGREDRAYSRKSMETLLQGLDPEQFLLVLDHQPVEAEENAALGCDLMLSGHTHNGQIWPAGYITALMGPSYGEYAFGDMTAIVSSGLVGWAYAIRTQGVCEYVLIDLAPL